MIAVTGEVTLYTPIMSQEAGGPDHCGNPLLRPENRSLILDSRGMGHCPVEAITEFTADS